MKPTSIKIVMGIWYPKINSPNAMLVVHGERGIVNNYKFAVNRSEVITYDRLRKIKPQTPTERKLNER